MYPQYARRSDLLKSNNNGLKVASGYEYIDQEFGYQITHGVDFEKWVLEYNDVISNVFEEEPEPYQVSDDDIEKAIRNHKVRNEELEGVPTVWDQIVGQGEWGSLIKGMFTFGPAGRLQLHLVLLHEAESDIQQSAEEIDEWIEVLVSTTPLIPYWPRVKMSLSKSAKIERLKSRIAI